MSDFPSASRSVLKLGPTAAIPFWVTENVRPAMVIVPVRGSGLGLGPTEKLTVPLPDPLAPLVMVIQFALLSPIHPQFVTELTFTAPVPDTPEKDALVAERDGAVVQGSAASTADFMSSRPLP